MRTCYYKDEYEFRRRCVFNQDYGYGDEICVVTEKANPDGNCDASKEDICRIRKEIEKLEEDMNL
jgi:hypothetical protein